MLADFPTDPIIETPLTPEPDPFFALGQSDSTLPPAEVAEGFTGARVFGDVRTCNPCRLLHNDLRFLQENHGWTISENADAPADWQILPARESDRQIPLVEYWRAGEIIDRETGYTDAESFDDRRQVLRELVSRHPVRLQESR
jgi:hypothetical protein